MSVLRVHEDWERREYNAESAEAEGAKRGLNVVASDERHLQLDLDTPMTEQQREALEILKRDTDLVDRELTTVSQHGRHHHYILLTRELDLHTRIMLQAVLGSDPRRELLSAMREGVRDPELVLFETDEEYPIVLRFLDRQDELLLWERGRSEAA